MRSTRPKAKETLALLKVLALGNRDVAAGRVKPVADVVARLRAKRSKVFADKCRRQSLALRNDPHEAETLAWLGASVDTKGWNGDPAPEEKRQALEAALRDGIESGEPRPFDFDAFKARMRAKRGGVS